MNPSPKLSKKIEGFRHRLSELRGDFEDALRDHPMNEQLRNLPGTMTTLLVAMYSGMEDATKLEIRWKEHTHGEFVKMQPRPIGTDTCPCCVFCGDGKDSPSMYRRNISLFVHSKADGEKVVDWFKADDYNGAWLDFREYEPNYLQVKMGACSDHYQKLVQLSQIIEENGDVLHIQDVRDLLKFV